jgi:hypothetical protein
VLRLEGDRASQARTQLQALTQAFHHILSTSSGGDGEERGDGGAMAMEEEGGARSMDAVRREAWREMAHCGLCRTLPLCYECSSR